MREAYHSQLDQVSDDLVEMTRLVGSAMNKATQALLDADLALAESVIAGDEAIDAFLGGFAAEVKQVRGSGGGWRAGDRRDVRVDAGTDDHRWAVVAVQRAGEVALGRAVEHDGPGGVPCHGG